jgi:hypothetical protein
MPNTILSSALSSPSLSITSFSNPENIAASLSVSKVTIKLRSKIFRHKTETGNTIVDARVVEPMTCEIDVFAPTLDSLTAINAVMLDRGTTYTIKSRGLVLTKMMMDQTGIKQSGDMLSASPVRLAFKELMTQGQLALGATTVAQPADSTLIDQGLQTVSDAVSTVQGLAATIAGNIGSAVTSAASTLGL